MEVSAVLEPNGTGGGDDPMAGDGGPSASSSGSGRNSPAPGHADQLPQGADGEQNNPAAADLPAQRADGDVNNPALADQALQGPGAAAAANLPPQGAGEVQDNPGPARLRAAQAIRRRIARRKRHCLCRIDLFLDNLALFVRHYRPRNPLEHIETMDAMRKIVGMLDSSRQTLERVLDL